MITSLQPSEWEQIVICETPGVHCTSPDSSELRCKSRKLKKAIWSDTAGEGTGVSKSLHWARSIHIINNNSGLRVKVPRYAPTPYPVPRRPNYSQRGPVFEKIQHTVWTLPGIGCRGRAGEGFQDTSEGLYVFSECSIRERVPRYAPTPCPVPCAYMMPSRHSGCLLTHPADVKTISCITRAWLTHNPYDSIRSCLLTIRPFALQW